MKPSVTILLCFCTQFLIAQFPNIKWDYFTGAPAFGSAAAADLDEDGFYEIVFTTYTNDGRAHCLNAEDGSPKWVFDIGGCGDVAPIIYDVNNDGQEEVIINGSCNPTLFCINGQTGALLWSAYSGGGDSSPTIADMDGDGIPEILFCNFSGEIRIHNGMDGSLKKSIQADPFQAPVQTAPAIVDVNNDGQLDIIVSNYWNNDGLYTWAFDYATGDKIWTHHTDDSDAEFHAYHGGAVADIDNDGLLEYVIGSWSGRVQAINVEDGSERWTALVKESNFSAITIADLDEDGELEVIFNNNDWVTSDERIRILSGMDGTQEWSYPINFSSFRGMSITDIDGNGHLDLVSGHFMGMLRVVEPYSGLVWELNLRNEFTENFPWFETDHGPLLADFDQNGTMDIFVVAGYGSYPPDSLNTGKAFLVEAGMGTCPEWLMFRHDILRTGYLSSEEVADACNINSTAFNVVATTDFSIYPNPNNGQFNWQFQIPHTAEVSLSIVDATGKIIEERPPTAYPAGFSLVEWKINNDFPNGIYFCKMAIDQQPTVYQKLIIQQ